MNSEQGEGEALTSTKNMEKVSLLTGLLSFIIGPYFNQSIEDVSLFTGLLSLTTTTANTTAYTTGGTTVGANTTEAATMLTATMT